MFRAIDPTLLAVRLLMVAFLGGGALLLIAARTQSPPVYTVAAVRAGLIRSPGEWVGHTIRVRAMADDPCMAWIEGSHNVCMSWQPVLVESSAPGAEALPLRSSPQLPQLAALRRLPLARWLVGSPQQIRSGALATYRVLLKAAPTSICGAAPCYIALLLDSTPGTLQKL